jgi:O-antigen/teichoic acid export membrane protein
MPHDGRVRAVGKLAVGSILGYGVIVMLTPVLTRLYSPADLGEFSAIAAVIGILPPLMTLGYPFGQLSARGIGGALRFGVIALIFAFSFLLVASFGSRERAVRVDRKHSRRRARRLAVGVLAVLTSSSESIGRFVATATPAPPTRRS